MTDSTASESAASESALQAAAEIVEAFGSHDTERYFAGFSPDATFLFHAEPALVPSRDAYLAMWRAWEADGFRVLSCLSVGRRLDLITDDVAVFTHAVRTRLAGVEDEQRERETIVLRRGPDGRWLGVHEHLSLDTQP